MNHVFFRSGSPSLGISDASLGRALSTELVNSLTGWGSRSQIVARALRCIFSASHPLVTLIRLTLESAPTTACRYLATGGSPALVTCWIAADGRGSVVVKVDDGEP